MLWLQILALCILLLLSGFFSGSETALMSLSGIKVRNMVEQRKRGAVTLQKLKQKPHRLIVTILVGNNLANIGASSLATVLFTDLFGSSGVGLAVGIMTFAVLVFGEITPKSAAMRYAPTLSRVVAPVILFLTYALYPVVIILEGITGVVLIFFGKRKEQELTEEELRTIVTMGEEEGVIDGRMAEMMRNVLEFKSTKVNEVMTPATNLVMINGKDRIKDIINLVNSTPYSKYPVYIGKQDNVVGYLHVDDVLRVISKHKTKTRVEKLAKELYVVPESKEVGDLLIQFQRRKTTIAVVVDEYKNVVGLVTLDDVLEEIVGEIFEQHTFKKLRKTGKAASVEASVSISDINRVLDLDIESENFTTIAGLMEHKLARIPHRGDQVVLGNVVIIATKVDRTGVISVRIEKK